MWKNQPHIAIESYYWNATDVSAPIITLTSAYIPAARFNTFFFQAPELDCKPERTLNFKQIEKTQKKKKKKKKSMKQHLTLELVGIS